MSALSRFERCIWIVVAIGLGFALVTKWGNEGAKSVERSEDPGAAAGFFSKSHIRFEEGIPKAEFEKQYQAAVEQFDSNPYMLARIHRECGTIYRAKFHDADREMKSLRAATAAIRHTKQEILLLEMEVQLDLGDSSLSLPDDRIDELKRGVALESQFMRVYPLGDDKLLRRWSELKFELGRRLIMVAPKEKLEGVVVGSGVYYDMKNKEPDKVKVMSPLSPVNIETHEAAVEWMKVVSEESGQEEQAVLKTASSILKDYLKGRIASAGRQSPWEP